MLKNTKTLTINYLNYYIIKIDFRKFFYLTQKTIYKFSSILSICKQKKEWLLTTLYIIIYFFLI